MRLIALLCLVGFCLRIECRALPAAPDWQAQFQQGKELLRQKNYSEARQCFERVTQLQPRNAEAFFTSV
jgi:Flp pilus assembly protein TadD